MGWWNKLVREYKKCVSCGKPAKGDWCQFCLEEE